MWPFNVIRELREERRVLWNNWNSTLETAQEINDQNSRLLEQVDDSIQIIGELRDDLGKSCWREIHAREDILNLSKENQELKQIIVKISTELEEIKDNLKEILANMDIACSNCSLR